MSERSISRALLRAGALTTAVVLAFGGTSAAFAQEDPTSTSPTPTETSTPAETSTPSAEPTPSSSEPAPSSSTPTSESAQPTEPAQPTESAAPANEAPTAPAETPKAAVGKFTVKFIHDKDGDSWDDPGEEIAGLKVTVLNETTGAKAADFVSGPDGKIVFTGIPAGPYWGVFDTAWKLRNGQGGMPVHVPVSDTGSGAIYLMEPGTSPADLRGSLTFEKSSYESHEIVRMTATVTNIGGQTAHHAKLMGSLYEVETAEEQWGDFGWRGAGVELASGESRTFQVSGPIRNIRDGKARPSTIIEWDGRPNPCQCGLSGEVAVVQTKGEISGLAYTDRNRNGQQDAGEATAGVVVEANGGVPYGYFKTTTDADGRYSIKDLPSGDYYVGHTFADGWVAHSDGTDSKVRVQPGAPVSLTARGERPYTESLSASLTLDKDVYQVGEEAKITITLTNSGDRPLGNIQAWCNRIGDDNQLGGSPGNGPATGWGELLPPGKGVTVGAGETKTFIATEKVPQAAFTYGTVIASCGFAPHAGWNTDAAEASDSALVPGGFGSLTGDLYYDRNGNWTVDEGEAIGNTRIVLRDRARGVDVAEAVSDAQGHVRFDRVPAGDWWAHVDGPWKFEGEWGGHVRVFAGSEWQNSFIVVPDVQPVAPGGGGGNTPPAPAGGGTGDALAKTGASVLGLGLVGALLVAFGFGASVIGRRRLA